VKEEKSKILSDTKAIMAEDEDSDSDEWGMEELDIPSKLNQAEADKDVGDAKAGDDEDYWKVESKAVLVPEPQKEAPPVKAGEPMIIVDITQINPDIHSKFDRNSVNDAEASSAMRKKIESNYEQYAKNSKLLADGTVVPCGSSVWRGALVRLRDERSGHYFVPIFPPKK
jgi:hypothetical protein